MINIKAINKIVFNIVVMSFILLLVGSCTENRYYKSLIEVDRLCRVNPDSATIVLHSISKDIQDAPEKLQMYYRLLCIQASDKTDNLHPMDNVENIADIISYYEREGDERALSLAYYYAGRIYVELYEYRLALSYFQKSDEALKKSNDIDLHSRIYSQMGYVLKYQEVYDEAVMKFVAAYECNKETNDTSAMIYDLSDISRIYLEKKDYDKAFKYLNDAYSMAKQKDDLKMSLIVETYMSSLYEITNDKDSALKYAENPLKYIALLDSGSVYSLMSDIYEMSGNEDSVLYYSKQIELVGDAYAKEDAYKKQVEIYLRRKDYSGVSNSLKMYWLYADSVKNMKRTDVIARMNAVYNYQAKEKENIMLSEKNRRNVILIISSSVISIILFLSFILYIRYSKVKRQQLLLRNEQSEKMLNDSLRMSEEYIHKNRKRIDELETRINVIDKENVELKQTLEYERERLVSANAIAELEVKRRDVSAKIIKGSSVYHHFCEIASNKSGQHASETDWDDLEKLVNSEYENFAGSLNSLYRLSTIEYRVSMLIKINIEPGKIAVILCCSDSNISTIRSRLYQKVFGRKGSSKDWDEFIRSL